MFIHFVWNVLRSKMTVAKQKNIRIENGPYLRIYMDTKLNIPGISKTYISVAPWAAIFTRFWSQIKISLFQSNDCNLITFQ